LQSFSSWSSSGSNFFRGCARPFLRSKLDRVAREGEDLWRYLTRRHKRRRPRRARPSRDTIKDRAFIRDRPKDIEARADIGHWEGDLIICKWTRPVLVLHERKSRVTLAARLTGKTAAEIISVMLAVFGRINPVLRKSITFDNDTASAGLARRRRSRPTRRRARGVGSRA
jgi:IS30 family transposase